MNVAAEPTSTAAVSDEALRKAEQYIEEEEGAANHMGGRLGIFLAAVAIVMSLFHMYAAYAIVPTQTLRPIHVAFVRSEEHTSELQSLMRISYAVFCLKKTTTNIS